MLFTQQIRSTFERRIFWAYLTYETELVFQSETSFENLVARASLDKRLSEDIRKDIMRTFPELHFFNKDQDGGVRLTKLLKAVSVYHEIGYIQGMNFIGAVVLTQCSLCERQAFVVFSSLLQRHRLSQVFDFTKGGTFRKLCFQLEALTFFYLPEVHLKLKQNKVPVDVYASSWFVTMFATELQFDILPSILDLYLQIGQEALIKIGLALLHELKDNLKICSPDEVMQLMSSPQTRE